MLMHTPAKGSPVFKRTSRISPTLADSGFVLENNWVRAPVGSSNNICSAVSSLIGSRWIEAGDDGGGKVLIVLVTGEILV